MSQRPQHVRRTGRFVDELEEPLVFLLGRVVNTSWAIFGVTLGHDEHLAAAGLLHLPAKIPECQPICRSVSGAGPGQLHYSKPKQQVLQSVKDGPWSGPASNTVPESGAARFWIEGHGCTSNSGVTLLANAQLSPHPRSGSCRQRRKPAR